MSNASGNTDVLTERQVDYAISQMVERAQNGPYTGMVALIKHFAALATDRAGQAKKDADKLIAALAKDRAGKRTRAAYEKERRVQFLRDIKMDTGYRE